MSVVDSSALLAIYFDEPEAAAFKAAIAERPAHIPAPAVAEASLRLLHQGLPLRETQRWFDALRRAGVKIADFTDSMARIAVAARSVYRRPHRAALNYGDCLVYAAAKILGEPLLCKGDDFHYTDIELHPASPRPLRMARNVRVARIAKDGTVNAG